MKKLLALLLILALFCACTPAAPSDTSSAPSETVSQETSSTDEFVAQPLTTELKTRALEILRLYGNPQGFLWTNPNDRHPLDYLSWYQDYRTYTANGIHWANNYLAQAERDRIALPADDIDTALQAYFGLDIAAWKARLDQTQNQSVYTAVEGAYQCVWTSVHTGYEGNKPYTITAVSTRDDVWKIDFTWQENPSQPLLTRRLTVRVSDEAVQFLAYTDQNDAASFTETVAAVSAEQKETAQMLLELYGAKGERTWTDPHTLSSAWFYVWYQTLRDYQTGSDAWREPYEELNVGTYLPAAEFEEALEAFFGMSGEDFRAILLEEHNFDQKAMEKHTYIDHPEHGQTYLAYTFRINNKVRYTIRGVAVDGDVWQIEYYRYTYDSVFGHDDSLDDLRRLTVQMAGDSVRFLSCVDPLNP